MMRNKKINNILIYSVVLLFSSTYAITPDNRFFFLDRLYDIPYDTTKSYLGSKFFVSTAQDAYRAHGDDALPLPELFGVLDQNVLGKALTAVGKPNPLPSAWQGKEILWNTSGKVQVQALFFELHSIIYGPLSTGISAGFMNVHGYNSYKYNNNRSSLILGPGDPTELEESLRQMFTLLDVNSQSTSHKAFSDIDWYFRLGKHFDYILKFRSIDVGARFGFLLPTGSTRDEFAAASVPFGGDGHWGFYGAIDGTFEVKEDMKAGFFVQCIKRLSRTLYKRMPALTEPQPLGAVMGNARINPGYTLVVAPYIMLENLRRGLGFLFQYTLRVHQQDQWHDARANKTVPVDLAPVMTRSQWGSDYFSLELFYDFGKERIVRDYDPLFFLRWDIPYKALVSERSAKGQQVSCGIGCLF